MREPATVERDRLPGDVAGVVAQEERNPGADVALGVAGAAQRAHPVEVGLVDGARGDCRGEALRHRERAHRVDPDVLTTPLERGGAAEQPDARLRRRVRRSFRQALDAGGGAEVDDAPAPPAQVRVHGLHRDEAADDVDVQLARE